MMASRLLILRPTRRRFTLKSHWMLLLIALSSPLSIRAIPFSTVFRRTASLLKRPLFGMHQYDERIPWFLRKSPTSIAETVYSLLGGFATDSGRRHCKFSLSSALYEETISKTKQSEHVHHVHHSPESVHLQLGSAAAILPSYLHQQTDKKNDKHHHDNNDNKKKDTLSSHTSLLHTYNDTRHNITLSGFNVSKRKFSAFLNHTLATNPLYSGCIFNASYITTKNIVVDSMETRHELRNLWKQQRLLTDRTEILAIYKSDDQRDDVGVTQKRGGFSDLLHIYADRLSAIIQDEDEEECHKRELSSETMSTPILEILHGGGLLGWLQREYGKEETNKLLFENIQNMSTSEQYQVFQHFLEWFRLRFPYYYDKCDACGASAKDDVDIECIQDDGNDDTKTEHDEEQEGTFLGYIYPTDEELRGKASRTEIYQCHKCGSFTRFPRYNAASFVIHHERGRCGEYSMLLYRILRATGHTCRWIVDWADHVWAEVLLGDKWIHLDPCEAAVDKPLLYEEWGKQQTYIVAFHAPLANNAGSFDKCIVHSEKGTSVPVIEDVTLRYTSCNAEELQKRRDESNEELQDFVDQTIVELQEKLARVLNK